MPHFHEGLSLKRQPFVAEYIIDHNATAAYQRAGYRGTAETARRNASRLLTKADIQTAVKQAEEAALERVRLRQHEVFGKIRAVGCSNLADYLIDNEGTVKPAPGVERSVMRAIASVHKRTTRRTRGGETTITREVKVTLWNKTEALKLACQALGMLDPEKPKGDDQQAGNYFLTLVQIVQKHRLTSTAGREKFTEDADAIEISPVVSKGNGHGNNGHADK